MKTLPRILRPFKHRCNYYLSVTPERIDLDFQGIYNCVSMIIGATSSHNHKSPSFNPQGRCRTVKGRLSSLEEGENYQRCILDCSSKLPTFPAPVRRRSVALLSLAPALPSSCRPSYQLIVLRLPEDSGERALSTSVFPSRLRKGISRGGVWTNSKC